MREHSLHRWAPLIALAAGLLLPVAFAPFHLWPLAILCPAVLFYLAQRLQPGPRLYLAAYLFGLAFFGFGGHWIYHSIARFGAGPVVAWFVTPAFGLFFALFPLLAIWLAKRWGPRQPVFALWLAYPGAWVLVEWLRSWLLTGNTWLTLGFTQTSTSIGHLAPVFGYFGISLVVAVLAGALAWLALQPRPVRAGVAVAALATAFAIGWLIERPWTSPTGQALQVTLLQGNVSQDEKWLPQNREKTLRWYEERSREHAGVDLIIWPETAIPAWYYQVRESRIQPLAEDLAAQGTSLVVGAPVIDIEREVAHNSVIAVGPPDQYYHKRHLVPFGEYLPLRGLLGNALDFLGTPMDDFTPGSGPAPMRAAGHQLGVTVCYEIIFGDEVAAALPRANLLVNVSNDGWFGDSIGPHQHLQMARMRAMETGRYMLRATNTGVTAVIAPDGRVTERIPQFQEGVLTATVQPRQGATPYVQWLDWPAVGAAAFMWVIGVVVGRRRRRTTENGALFATDEHR